MAQRPVYRVVKDAIVLAPERFVNLKVGTQIQIQIPSPPQKYSGQDLALRAHCVHIAHPQARILTQEYLLPVY